MRRKPFGATGISLPEIGQGTWEMEKDPEASIAALRRGLDLGLAIVDTAEMYGDGKVEEIVGEAVRGRRDEAYLVSKVLPSNASFAGTVEACARSLRRLRTDHLDLYLLHWPGEHPLEDTIAAFQLLLGEGKILGYGVSNFDVPDLARAVQIAGRGRIAADQVLYHLEERAIEHAVLPLCESLEIAVMAYSPFGSGRFPSARSAEGRVLAEIARALGATPRQVALRFLTRRSSVFAIPKSSTIEHVQENAAAARLELAEEDVRRIDEAFPIGPPPRELPTL
jgi:diketogulonate reductase-like aldo/keto reductase